VIRSCLDAVSFTEVLRVDRRHSGQSLGERPGPDAFYESRVIQEQSGKYMQRDYKR
jgi:hypothetical protein